LVRRKKGTQPTEEDGRIEMATVAATSTKGAAQAQPKKDSGNKSQPKQESSSEEDESSSEEDSDDSEEESDSEESESGSTESDSGSSESK